MKLHQSILEFLPILSFCIVIISYSLFIFKHADSLFLNLLYSLNIAMLSFQDVNSLCGVGKGILSVSQVLCVLSHGIFWSDISVSVFLINNLQWSKQRLKLISINTSPYALCLLVFSTLILQFFIMCFRTCKLIKIKLLLLFVQFQQICSC